MIRLKDYKKRISESLDTALQRFAAEHPKERPTTSALYCCPWSGWVSLCINTGDTDQDHRDNCPDFDYCEYDLMECRFNDDMRSRTRLACHVRHAQNT